METDDRNRRAIAMLKRAQRLAGVRSSTAFGRKIAEISGGAPSRSSYLRWVNGEAAIPAWALEAAAEVAGTTLASLSLLPGDGQEPPPEWRERMEETMDHMHRAVGDLQAEVLALRGQSSSAPDSADHPVGSETGWRAQMEGTMRRLQQAVGDLQAEVVGLRERIESGQEPAQTAASPRSRR